MVKDYLNELNKTDVLLKPNCYDKDHTFLKKYIQLINTQCLQFLFTFVLLYQSQNIFSQGRWICITSANTLIKKKKNQNSNYITEVNVLNWYGQYIQRTKTFPIKVTEKHSRLVVFVFRVQIHKITKHHLSLLEKQNISKQHSTEHLIANLKELQN